jgi:4-amino-4-deoxy-L-arabinose transferase-like glycosyltransferase
MLKPLSNRFRLKQPVWQYVLLLLLFIPLLFANMGPSHDWGDDFAQYIHQGINIAEGLPQTQTGYVYNPENPMMGPRAYPIGFPLMLAGVYALAGNYIENYILFVSILLIVYLFVLFVYLKLSYRWHLALFGVLLIAYNPVVIAFKREVMADIPFALLLLLFLLLMRGRSSLLKYFLGGLLVGLLICTKGIGWAILPALMVHAIFQAKRNQTKGLTLLSSLWPSLIMASLAIGIWFLLQKLLFNVPADYTSNFLEGGIVTSIFTNISYYQQVGMSALVSGFEYTGFLGVFAGACALVSIVLGIIRRATNPGFEDWVFVFYMLVLLIYPYQGSGFRFLLPMIPLLLLYLANGLQEIVNKLFVRPSKMLLVIGFLAVGQYIPDLFYSVRAYGNSIIGPQDQSALHAFSYLEHKLPAGATIAFAKPRALSLYTRFNGFAVGEDQKIYQIDKQFKELGINYYLVCTQVKDANLERYISVRKKTIQKVWENDKFILYQRL